MHIYIYIYICIYTSLYLPYIYKNYIYTFRDIYWMQVHTHIYIYIYIHTYKHIPSKKIGCGWQWLVAWMAQWIGTTKRNVSEVLFVWFQESDVKDLIRSLWMVFWVYIQRITFAVWAIWNWGSFWISLLNWNLDHVKSGYKEVKRGIICFLGRNQIKKMDCSESEFGFEKNILWVQPIR